MAQGNFFAMISRMKYINRWSLMRNSRPENLSEHSLEVAVVAHALAVIRNTRCAGSLNAERAALLGLYHDAPESLTGDMPTPVKYHSEQLRNAYRSVEDNACHTLVDMLPAYLAQYYAPFFFPEKADAELWQIVKAADKICALIKCIEEKKAGNTEFEKAAESLQKAIAALHLPEADIFMSDFLPAYAKSLDELKED